MAFVIFTIEVLFEARLSDVFADVLGKRLQADDFCFAFVATEWTMKC
jgi:hypothetical protein